MDCSLFRMLIARLEPGFKPQISQITQIYLGLIHAIRVQVRQWHALGGDCLSVWEIAPEAGRVDLFKMASQSKDDCCHYASSGSAESH
jgi:hypothetical protein